MLKPINKPLHITIKPVGAKCNLRCDYCYYLEKENLYPNTHLMSEELLEEFIAQYLANQVGTEATFSWHGGEPLLHTIQFYEKAIQLQQKYSDGRFNIHNTLQTNGTLITHEWCKFFKQHNFLIGLSIDGDQTMHNINRHTITGKGTFDQVMHAAALLNHHQIEWNGMATVNSYNANYPKEFYQFFKKIKCHYIQFTPIVERITQHSDGRHLASAADNDIYQLSPHSVTPQQWGNFLCQIYDEWLKTDIGHYFIQLFDSTLANWVGEAPSVCTMCRNCGHAIVIEHNGDIYPCDHYVFPEYKLGNIKTQTLNSLIYSSRQERFSTAKSGMLPSQCLNCPHLQLCNGGCPKDRFIKTAQLGNHLNYLCSGYQQYFQYSTHSMLELRQTLEKQQLFNVTK